jgi:hypothetical protein
MGWAGGHEPPYHPGSHGNPKKLLRRKNNPLLALHPSARRHGSGEQMVEKVAGRVGKTRVVVI